MKKFAKRAGVVLLAAAAVCAAVMAFTACGGAPALTATYGSSSHTFMSVYPDLTFKQLTTVVQTINVYDDGSYMLVQNSRSLSGDLSFDPSNTGDTDISGVSDRGYETKIFYGTYTSAEEDGMITLTISAPTGAVYVSSGSAMSNGKYYTTYAWTDKMGTDAGGEDGAMTAEQYLESVSYGEKSIIVDTSTMSFTYVNLSASA